MTKRKPLEELTLMDDYMFAQVMQNLDLLKPLLEFILDTKIVTIKLAETQKSIDKGYQYHGIRLDLYVEDENGVVYDVEAQAIDKKNLPKRMRFYQSTIDLYKLERGVDYNKLGKSYIIFLTNYDPYDRDRYIYTFSNLCHEEADLPFGDEAIKVIANITGNKGTISPQLQELFAYLKDGSVTGEYSKELDDAVKGVKESEEGRTNYMRFLTYEMELKEEAREEAREEMLADLVKKGIITIQAAAAEIGLSETAFRQKMTAAQTQ